MLVLIHLEENKPSIGEGKHKVDSAATSVRRRIRTRTTERKRRTKKEMEGENMELFASVVDLRAFGGLTTTPHESSNKLLEDF
jgi:hypothetical protein